MWKAESGIISMMGFEPQTQVLVTIHSSLSFLESGLFKGLARNIRANLLKSLNERIMLLKIKAKHIYIFALIGVLYFSGIAAIVYPMISNVHSLKNSKSAITDYKDEVKNMPDEDIEKKFRNADKYNADIANGVYKDGLEFSLSSNSEVMCYVDIPSVNIYLPVYYGTSDEVLQKGCGWLENTSLPVGGNSTHSVISAHTGLPSAEMFTNLDQVEMGDVFYVHVLNRVLAYKVDQIEKVTPNRTDLLKIQKDMDFCTLLTCTPYGINDKRLLVRGVRVDYIETASSYEENAASSVSYSKDDSDSELQGEIQGQLFVIFSIIIGAVLLYAGAGVWLVISIKRSHAKNKNNAGDNDG